MRKSSVLLITVLLVLAAGRSAGAAEGDRTLHFLSRFGEGAFDVVILRPLSAAALVAGSAFFVASVPLVWPFEGGWHSAFSSENVRPSYNTFIYGPYEYVVLRDIGDF